ncbi:cobalt-precorrin-6A reductase [Rhodospirillaceae bacterium KN72]|uniref:Cobalt-precorrin-6A reductase n=1 Tax=Pacificispira spongiicola TaxID=2729598 RepID=A0A7Y0HET9_9PROT|nr:cobalt-precorrin-6A reductase [Pacificispira spongiicola]NMM45065.1 cobalt-precorrin-6A reductase [Pacificispira spongiicola]
MTKAKPRILILGGTGEARRLATLLADDYDIKTSLAGRTTAPKTLPGRMRIGGFGGAGGLAEYLVQEGVQYLVDATHPYAARMGANAALAAARCAVPLLRLERPAWVKQQGDRWVEFENLDTLVAALPGLGKHAFVSLGGAGLEAFSGLTGMQLTVRAIDPPPALTDRSDITLILDQGPFDLAGERELLSERGADVLVSRNAGGAATYAKIAAARELGITVALLDRPERPRGVETAGDPETAARRITECLASLT